MDLLREKMRLMALSGPQDSGGGGGGGSSTGSQTQIAELPEWARPYAQNVLAKGEALTSATTPATYGGQRYAGLSDLQKQAMGSIATPEAYQKTLQTFMDPYAQNVIDIQKREAGRQSQMAGLQEAGQAVKMGAFGGSRAGLVEAERQRNLGQLMGDIQARGSEAAYQNAQQAMQRDITNKMQLGALQQQDIQRPLDIAYQDFLTQQNYPYKQLGFMSDLIRGLPLGQQSTRQVYEPGPTGLQALGALGMGAYGLKSLFGAEGGLMESYADGGSVMDKFNDPSAMMLEMDKLTDEQLQAIVQSPSTQAEYQAAVQELTTRASERRGMASAYNQLPQETQERMLAGGGIVAFAKGGTDDSEEDDTDPQLAQEQMLASPGNPGLYSQFGQELLSATGRLKRTPDYKTKTNEEIQQAEEAEIARSRRLLGGDIYEPALKRLEEQDQTRGRSLEQAKGLAALQAIPAILRPGNALRGLGEAGAVLGKGYEQALQADRAEKRYLSQMQFNIADAKRKENAGLYSQARQSVAAAETARLNAYKAGIARDQAIGTISARGLQATKPVGTGAGGAGKLPQVDRQAAALSDKIETLRSKNPNDPNLPLLEKQLEGRMKIIAAGKDVGPTRAGLMSQSAFNQASAEVQKMVRGQALQDQEYLDALGRGDSEGQAKALDRLTVAQMKRSQLGGRDSGTGNPKTPPPPPGFVYPQSGQ